MTIDSTDNAITSFQKLNLAAKKLLSSQGASEHNIRIVEAALSSATELESSRLLALAEALKTPTVAKSPELTKAVLIALGVNVPKNEAL